MLYANDNRAARRFGTYNRLNVAIYQSDMDVLRAARKRLAKAARRNPALRAERKAFYREMLACHASARRLALSANL